MSLPRPTVAPDFATDANFPVGANPWNGQANKVQPTGIVGSGFMPETMMAPEWMNFILNNLAKWIDYLDARGGRATNFEDIDRDFEEFIFGNTLLTTTTAGLLPSGLTEWKKIAGNGQLQFNGTALDGIGICQIQTADGNAVSHQLLGPAFVLDTSADFGMIARLSFEDHSKLETNANGGVIVQVENCGFRGGSTHTYWEIIDPFGSVQAPLVQVALAVDPLFNILRIIRLGGTLYYFVDGTLVYQVADTSAIGGGQRYIQVKGIAGVGANFTYVNADYHRMQLSRAVL